MRKKVLKTLVTVTGILGLTCPMALAQMGPVHVMGVWGGDELKAFRSVTAGWEKKTGAKVEFEGTRDLAVVLRARAVGKNPPDLAVLPNPALMREFARKGLLRPIGPLLKGTHLERNFNPSWLDLGSVDGTLFGLFVKATVKNTVWYSPREFKHMAWQPPPSWEGLIALSDDIRSKKKTPWALGVESGAASGWPASDWIQEILLHQSGGDLYDRWVEHRIPWSHEAVKSAFEKFGKIALAPGYVSGGATAILATHFMDASYLPFMKPPQAYLYFLGSFTQGFITKQFPDLRPGEDYDFFPFPSIDSRYAGATTGAADGVVLFRDTPSSRSLLQYLAEGKNWEPWARRGGYTSPNRSMDTHAYSDPVTAKVARSLNTSSLFRFDADDLMTAEVQKSFWKGAMDYLRHPGSLREILERIERVARESNPSEPVPPGQ